MTEMRGHDAEIGGHDEPKYADALDIGDPYLLFFLRSGDWK